MMRISFLASISAVGAVCGMVESASAQNPNNEHKFFIPRSAIVFSPRWAETSTHAPEDYMSVANQYGANVIGWHYPQNLTQLGPNGGAPSDALLVLAQAANYGAKNCALPAITRNTASACKDGSGNPIVHHASSLAYYPDTNSAQFRNEVKSAIQFAHQSGCTSLQQDDAWFMVDRRPQGCYANTSESIVKNYVHSYYAWLRYEIANEFGQTIPLTYNKKLHPTNEFSNSKNELALHFNGVMAEIGEGENYPERLFNALEIVNNQYLNQRTITTLVSTSPLRNRRAISTVYALGGHPIIPYDVFVGVNEPRYYGPISTYKPYYDLVRNNPQLFDGHGILDVYIDHYQNTAGIIKYANGLTGVVGRSNMMAVLNKNSGSSRVLHIVNWKNETRYFTMWIDKSHIPFTPTMAVVKRPGMTDYSVPVFDNGDNRWKVTISGVDVWAVAELVP